MPKRAADAADPSDAQSTPGRYSARIHGSLSEIDRAAWNRLALQQTTPLLEWDLLNVFETSGSICAETGWQPVHLAVYRHDQENPAIADSGRLVAAAPLYIKSHSMGEFVFDYAWADVAEQLSVEYYPKLVGMVPATPAVGYRFLIDAGEDERTLTFVMLEQIDAFCNRHSLHSSNFLFVDAEWGKLVEEWGYRSWLHQSYNWHNPGFADFDDYVAQFDKNQRRNIRRESASMGVQGLDLRVLDGTAVDRTMMLRMWRLYKKTNDQFGPWAARFLNREFFLQIAEAYGNRLRFVCAYESTRTDEPVAMAFLIHKGTTLIGRYWGTLRHYDNLHFAVCYYEPIRWAITNGVRDFDPGAGSSHKLRRGFRAVVNHSYHRFFDRTLATVFQRYIDDVNAQELAQVAAMNATVPFRHGRSAVQ